MFKKKKTTKTQLHRGHILSVETGLCRALGPPGNSSLVSTARHQEVTWEGGNVLTATRIQRRTFGVYVPEVNICPPICSVNIY